MPTINERVPQILYNHIFEYRQIWLNMLINYGHLSNITKLKKKTLLGMFEGNVRQIPYCLAASTLIILFSEMLKMSKNIFYN